MSDHTSETTTIQLTKGYLAIVDAIDADLGDRRWWVSDSRSGAYGVRTVQANYKVTSIFLHRVIMARVVGRELQQHEIVDHIDGNTLNNTRANLRLTDRFGNTRNSKRRSDNKSGYKGVHCAHYKSGNSGWIASITLNGRSKHLGVFKTPQEAHEAYKKAALEHYGEFARFE